MAKKKTTSTKRKTSTRKARGKQAAGARDHAWSSSSTRRLVLASLGVLLAAGVVAATGFGIPALGRNAAARISTESRTVQIWLTPPGWMPQEVFDGVMDRAVAAYEQASGNLGPGEALSPEPLRAVQEAVAATGWAAEPPRVARRAPTRVEDDADAGRRNDVVIEMAWRSPVAVVRSSAFQFGARPGLRDTAIDANADVLPMSGPPESFPRLRMIINPSRLPQPTDARDTNPFWPGQDVRDAIKLLGLLLEQDFASQVAGVDLAEHADGRRLLIVTTTGGRVVWGAPPRGDGVFQGEVSDERKLANLASLVDATGYLDGGQSRVEIHWPGTVLIGDDAAQGGAGGGS